MSWPECQLPTLVTNKQTSDSYCLVKLIPENCIVNLRMDHMYNLWLKRSHTSTEFKLSKKYILTQTIDKRTNHDEHFPRFSKYFQENSLATDHLNKTNPGSGIRRIHVCSKTLKNL